jgi:RNA polymerase-binding transcription factor DksA
MERRKKPFTPARASTADILGAGPATPKIPAKWREHHTSLVRFRSRLAQRRGTLVKDASEEQPAYSLHMADAGTDTYDRDFALSIATSEQESLYEVDQAINRIENGSYGVCEVTGQPIEPERLKAIPWTRFSAGAEQELERNGVVKRARLGELADLPKTSEPEKEEEEE